MLTKEILCAYLPYDVKAVQSHHGKDELYSLYGIKYSEYAKEWTVFIDDSRHGDYQNVYLKGIRLALRPLSSLTKLITHNGETFVPMEKLQAENITIGVVAITAANVMLLPYWAVKKLHEWHFDTFNCLANGDAIELKEVDNG